MIYLYFFFQWGIKVFSHGILKYFIALKVKIRLLITMGFFLIPDFTAQFNY